MVFRNHEYRANDFYVNEQTGKTVRPVRQRTVRFLLKLETEEGRFVMTT